MSFVIPATFAAVNMKLSVKQPLPSSRGLGDQVKRLWPKTRFTERRNMSTSAMGVTQEGIQPKFGRLPQRCGNSAKTNVLVAYVQIFANVGVF